jgi:hypothetical protein
MRPLSLILDLTLKFCQLMSLNFFILFFFLSFFLSVGWRTCPSPGNPLRGGSLMPSPRRGMSLPWHSCVRGLTSRLRSAGWRLIPRSHENTHLSYHRAPANDNDDVSVCRSDNLWMKGVWGSGKQGGGGDTQPRQRNRKKKRRKKKNAKIKIKKISKFHCVRAAKRLDAAVTAAVFPDDKPASVV